MLDKLTEFRLNLATGFFKPLSRLLANIGISPQFHVFFALVFIFFPIWILIDWLRFRKEENVWRLIFKRNWLIFLLGIIFFGLLPLVSQ